MNSRPTLKDVGAAAGVSVYVASRALRGESGVAASTRAKVLAAASNLGYVRNEVAAGLKMKSSHAVGILTASGRNQYYSMLAQAIDTTLHEYGYFAVTNDMVKDRENTPESEIEAVKMLLEQRPAAIVVTYSLSPESLKIIESFRVPVVFVDSPPEAPSDYSFVGSDNYQAGRLAARYLGGLGHRRAVILAFPRSWRTFDARVRGFEDAARECGMDVQIIAAKGNDPDSACESLSGLLDQCAPAEWPDAVFALNTLMVMGAFRAMKSGGVAVGRDISLLAVDDFDWAPLLDPPLTVISQNLEEIGRQAARFVMDAIRGNSLQGQQLTIGVALVERESCVRRDGPRKVAGDDR